MKTTLYGKNYTYQDLNKILGHKKFNLNSYLCKKIILQFLKMTTMRIHLQCDNKVTIMCKESDPIQSILEEYQEKTGMPYKDFLFAYGKKDLAEHCKETVGQLNIKDEQTIYVGAAQRGGYSGINFNSMDKPIHQEFSKTAPKWRIVDKGLNLEGRCKNSACQAYEKKVWIQKGFGTFMMNKEVKKCKCPLCPQMCKQVNNIGLFMATCQGTGMIQGEEQEKKMFSEHRQKTGILTYEDKEETRCNWDYLELQVTPVKNA